MTRQEYDRIALAGFQARQNGQSMMACPYKTGQQMNAWEAGWLKADRERRK